MAIELYLLIAVIAAMLAGFRAHERGHSGFLWFLLTAVVPLAVIPAYFLKAGEPIPLDFAGTNPLPFTRNRTAQTLARTAMVFWSVVFVAFAMFGLVSYLMK